MTLIAAVQMGDGRVMMAGDSFVGSDGDHHATGTVKVHRAGRVLVGIAGEIAAQDFFSELLSVPEYDDSDPMRWVKRVFGGAVRDGLRKHRLSATEVGSEVLVAVGGKIFAFQGRVGTHGFTTDFGAIGSAVPWAQGVLEVTGGMAPRTRLSKALKVAAKYSSSVRPPFKYIIGGC